MEEVGIVGLEVQVFVGGVGGDEDAQWIFGWIGVEAVLDLFVGFVVGYVSDDGDAVVGVFGVGDCLVEDFDEVVFCVFVVFGEDENVVVVLFGCWFFCCFVVFWEVGVYVFVDLVD